MILVVPFLVAFVLSAALVPLCRALSLRLGYLTVPTEVGHPPSRAKARFGGAVIPLTVFVCSLAINASLAVPVLIACGCILFLFGIASDMFAIKPSTKVVALTVIGCAFLFFDYRLHWAESVTLDSVLTLLWIVGVTSAFNLLDHMDGLCGGIALIAGITFLVSVLPVEFAGRLVPQVQYLAVVLGAIAGFLLYNISPAAVALGDSGSLFVGFNMAAMTLLISPGRGSDLLSIVAVPVLLMLIPILDATLVAISRVLARPAFVGTAYTSHRLVAIGLPERTAVRVLWALAAVSGLIGVLADRSQSGIAGVLAAMFTIGLALLAAFLMRVQIHDDLDPNQPLGQITPLGTAGGYKRRLTEVLLDVLLVSVAYYGAYRLRFEGAQYTANLASFLKSFPIVLGAQVFALFAVGAYRGLWRYFSLIDGVVFAKGVAVGVIASQLIILYLYRFRDFSLSVFVVYGMLLFLLLVASRASFRSIREFVQRQRQVGRRLAIYGVGDAGSTTVRRLLNDSRSAYRIIGFIDDDVLKRDVRVYGYRVLGGYQQLVDLIMAGEVDVVLLAYRLPDTSGLSQLCARYNVTLYRLPLDWVEVGSVQVGRQAASVSSVQREFREAASDTSSESRIVKHAFSVDVEDWFLSSTLGS